MHGPETSAPWPHPPRAVLRWLPVIASLAVQLPVAVWRLRPQGAPGRDPLGPWLAEISPADALTLVLAVAGPLVLLAAVRFPGPVVAIEALFGSVDILVGGDGGPPFVAFAFAIVIAIVRGARVWAFTAVAVGWVATLGIAIAIGDQGWTIGRVAWTTIGILLVLGIGEAIRTRTDRAMEFARLARERHDSEVRAERVRIARELHDVLAHSLSQINVQAGVGLHLLDRQPDKAAAALASIKETSKSALDEVRAVLGLLRAEGSVESAPLVPEPDLDRLAALVAPVEGAAPVELVDRLKHEQIPKPVQLAVYRIVQESITNARRHAIGATIIAVTLDRDDEGITVRVHDDGTSADSPAAESGGRGLLGMRERAELLGGRLSAGPAAGGGFAVTAQIPLVEQL